MKALSYVLLLASALALPACQDSNRPTDPTTPQEGIVTGKVVDSQGKPVANAHITADNDDYYNTTSSGYTDANGTYRIKLPTGIAAGSYHVNGSLTLKYHGRITNSSWLWKTTARFRPTTGPSAILSSD